MTVDEFVRNNRGINERKVMEEGKERKIAEDLPRGLLVAIYINIQVLLVFCCYSLSSCLEEGKECRLVGEDLKGHVVTISIDLQIFQMLHFV